EELGTVSPDKREELLRVLHTLKGNSAMMGYQIIAEQVHQIENVLKVADDSVIDTLDAIFEISAALRSAIERLGGPEQDEALARLSSISFAPAARASRTSGPRPPATRVDSPAAT